MLFFKNMFYYMAKIVHVFFIYLFIYYLFIYFIASKTHTKKKQKLHTINKVIKRKK